MAFELSDNELLREQGWRVFRSASRDHLLPATSAGRTLQRIVLREALPAAGVAVGAVALSDEERAAARVGREALAAEVLARRLPEFAPTTRHISFFFGNLLAIPAAGSEEIRELAIAPGDGFINEIIWQAVTSGTSWLLAIRTEGGESVFYRGLAQNPAPFPSGGPDFVNPLGFNISTAYSVSVMKCFVPVKSGERIFAIMRMPGPGAVNTNRVEAVMGFQFGDVSRVRKLDIEKGVIGVELLRRSEAQAEAARLVAVQAAEEKATAVRPRRPPVREEGPAAVVPPVSLPAPQMQIGQFGIYPFAGVFPPVPGIVPRPVAPPKLPPAPKVPPEGTGKTFVPAWLASARSIGYLIPTPARTERVTVFDQKYTIWDLSGRKVKEGTIELVGSEAQIPPGARISQELPG